MNNGFEDNRLDPFAASDDWQPGEDVVTHGATEIPPEMEFFAAPPAEIGEVQTAWSTLVTTKRPMGAGMRAFVCGLLGLGVGGVAAFLTNQLEGPVDPVVLACCAAGGILAAVIAVFATRFRHTCSYVGVEGMARYVIRGSRAGLPAEELFVFQDADNLNASQTRQYVNGVYSGTNYDFTWTNSTGGKLLRLAGSFRSKEGFPKPKDPFHFARVGEVFWNAHLSARMQEELDSKGFVEFPVNKRDKVRVGNGFLEFFFKGETQRVPVEEIKTLSCNSGTFAIHTNDAGWFGSKGKFTFQYGQLGNAGMFVFAIEQLLGYEFGD